jgi:hypothetical protein
MCSISIEVSSCLRLHVALNTAFLDCSVVGWQDYSVVAITFGKLGIGLEVLIEGFELFRGDWENLL